MCEGKFRVHVDVFCMYGNRVYSDFIITVGKNWHDLELTKLDCKCNQQESRKNRLSNLFRRTK